jgi:hypothetical protein
LTISGTIFTVLIVVFSLAAIIVWQEFKRKNINVWLSAWLRKDWRAAAPAGATKHLLFCFVDHYEPQWKSPSPATADRRVARWVQEYPKLCAGHRDADGRQPVHSFFFPGEEYQPAHIDALVGLCRDGLGEIEIHLHHDNDTEAGLRESLRSFTRRLVDDHGALPVDTNTGQPLWCFIHGNWALDNSRPDGRWCGVDNEITVLKEEGCYADFTLPAAPDPCQTETINSIYYAIDDPHKPKSHNSGSRVCVGKTQPHDLMIIQGPLGLMWHNRKFGLLPRIENSDIRTSSPPTKKRIDEWVNMGIHVEGRPEWVIVKIHTHGTQEPDMPTLLGQPMDDAFTYLESRYNDGVDWKLHYVSARETYNIIKAAEAGYEGDPGAFRDFLIPKASYAPRVARDLKAG